MDTTEKKLVVFLDPLFFIDFYAKRKEVKDLENDNLYSSILNFSNVIFNSDNNEIISAVSEKRISKDDFDRAKTTLGTEKDFTKFRQRYEGRIISKNPITNSQRTIFLIQESDQYVFEKQKKSWILWFNLNTAFSEFSKLSFDSKLHKVIGIVPESNNTKSPFSYSTLKKFKIITNEAVIVDPFISTWDESKVLQNLIPLLKNLFLENEVPGYRFTLKIITLYDRPYSDINLNKKSGMPKTGKAKVVDKEVLKDILVSELNLYKIDYSLTYILKYKVDRGANRINPFSELVLNYFHDRNYFSNFIYCKSGNSGDYNKFDPVSRNIVVTSDTDLTLFSLLDDSNYKRVIQHSKRLQELEKYKKMNEFSEYFECFEGKIN